MEIKHNHKGFTLVEAMVVVAIILILAAFAVPAIREAMPNYRLRSLSYDILASAQRARALAVQQNQDMDICFYNDRYRIYTDTTPGECNDTMIKEILFSDYGNARQGFTVGNPKCGDAGVHWEESTPPVSATSFSFSPRGTASAGTVYIENGEADANANNLCYSITAINTGAVKIRKYVECSDSDKKKCWIE